MDLGACELKLNYRSRLEELNRKNLGEVHGLYFVLSLPWWQRHKTCEPSLDSVPLHTSVATPLFLACLYFVVSLLLEVIVTSIIIIYPANKYS